MSADHDILAIGEPLFELSERDQGGQKIYLPGHGGDTSNCAVAAARQGARVAYFTALGDDAPGRSFLDLWDAEGIDRTTVIRRDSTSTGLYLISYGPDGHAFHYWRAGSAASRLEPAELPETQIAASRILHVSGISQAISTSACDAIFAAIALARRHGRLVSYDTNLRLGLWPLDRARAVIHAAMRTCDIALPGLDDARQLTALDTPEAICRFYLALGARVVALTLGADGTMVASDGRIETVAALPVQPVDATGAGDTFDGAFLAEYVRTGDAFLSAAYANAAAALSTQGVGAVAPMPRRAEVEALLNEARRR